MGNKATKYRRDRAAEALMQRNKTVLDDTPMKTDSIQMCDRIGGTPSEDVYKGLYLATSEVSLKTVRRLPEDEVRERIKSESQMMSKTQHPNIVQYIGLWTSPENETFIVSEYFNQGTLLFVSKELNDAPTTDETIRILQAISAGGSYLSDRHIIHRDLAARNIFIRKEGIELVAKIGNFSHAVDVDEAGTYVEKSSANTRYAAPEVLQHGTYSTKSDVWAFGVLMWESFEFQTNRYATPYGDFSNEEVSQRVIEGYRLPSPTACPPAVFNLVLSCWAAEPSDRPAFCDLWHSLGALLN